MSERFKECVLKAQASREAMGSNPIVPVHIPDPSGIPGT